MRVASLAYCARLLASALLTAGVAQSAYAFTPAQVPLNLGGQVEPNIMFLLDDSGSMRWGFMPDELDARWGDLTTCSTSNRGSYAGANTTFCSITGRQYLASSHLNTVYYDPTQTYLPPIRSDGTRFANATFTSAWVDGYTQSGGSINLSNNYRAIMDDYFHRRYTAGGVQFGGFTLSASPGSGETAFYYTYKNGCSNSVYSDSCYDKVVLGTSASAAAKQNFANWFSYYRTRLMAAKAGVSQAFYDQTGDIRVGYGAINLGNRSVDNVTTNTIARGVRRFENTGRSEFYDWLFASQADGATPLRRALGAAGEYYSRTDARGPWSSTPGQAGGTEYACRQSYTILTTDGYWNGDAASNEAARLNVDNLNGPTITGPDGASYRYVPKAPFSDSHANTLADVAMYYWNRDLHGNLGNRVPTSPENPAFWQHMVTFGVGLGVSGSVDAAKAFAAIKSGESITWPNPETSAPAKLDDLLHASLNSRGDFFSAADPKAFSEALASTLSKIAGRAGSNTSAVPNARRLDSETLVYEAFFSSSDWSGKLVAKRPTATSTGITFTEEWEAGSLLSSTSRRLFSHTGTSGVSLNNWASLSTAMKGHFDSNQALFNYLMGSRVNEAPAGLKYRPRNTLLGDIVNSTLVIANKQNWGYQGIVPNPTGTGAQTYNEFVASKASRTPTLFVGANDGFLHAFNANNGQEQFAYMPNGVLPNVKQLAASDYKHRYFVDGKLHVRDAVLNNQWRTVLVGGLGAGGKTVFALDVTDTSASGFDASKVLWEIKDDADLGFTYSEPLVGRMKNGKWVAIFGNGHGSTNNDSVLFIVDLETGAVNKVRAGTATGGMSTPSFIYAKDDAGHIYVDEIFAGDMNGNLWKFNLRKNGTSAADFEVSLKSGSTPQPLYVAADSTGKRQPITVKPEIAPHPKEGVAGNVIYFGTGRMYSVGDVTDAGVQSLYGIWDKKSNSGTSTAFTGRTLLDARSILFEGTAFDRQVRVLDAPTTDIDWGSKRGWVLDLRSPTQGAQGERVIFSPRILLGRLVVQTAIPSTDPCQGGGSGWTMVLDLETGGRLNYVLFDMNKDGKFDNADMVVVNGQPLPVSGIGSTTGIPTGGYDLLDKDRYWLCRGTGVDDCIPAANTLNIIEGRQSWMQLQ